MEKLLKFIYSEINTVGYKVFDKKPPHKTKYPFIEYSINKPARNHNPILYTLTIDIWDKNISSTLVENVASQVNTILEDLNYNDLDIQLIVKNQSRLKIDDPDPSIKRRQLTYQLRVFRIK